MAKLKVANCIAITVASLMHVVAASDYFVGNPTGGWDGRTDCNSWASAQTFAPGDTITFNYNSYHNVVEVTKDDYATCSTANPVSYDNSGSTKIVFVAPGNRYFICGGPGHCQAGMKMQVHVADLPAAATPSPLPQLPPPRQEKQRSHAPAPMEPLPLAPAPATKPPRHGGHRKRHSPPAMAHTVQSLEAYFPLAAPAPMSSPTPPTSSGAAAAVCEKWADGTAVLVTLGLVLGAL